METIDPGAGYMEEVVQNIRAFGLRGQDYCWYGGTVNQELTEVGAGWVAEGGDKVINAWNSMAVFPRELHQLVSCRVEGTTGR